MEPSTPRSIRLVVFFFMVLIGLWNFFLNVAARYKEHPFNHINGFPLWALNIITSTVYVACTVVYISMTWHYAKEHPYWSVFSLVLALLMTGSMIWAGLDLFDWFVWGPLVVDLAIIVRAGIEEVANSVESGLLRKTWNGFWGYETLPPQPPPQQQPQDDAHDPELGLEGAHQLANLDAQPGNNG
ncbi:hypothetical protein COCSADRAFT_81990 [Bipolaris sorokiniana ND90Pr]|uniref:Uncharacterized protein n=1 Tax=Cochliobolus sativus (strain ND90Pr / ATCC 201652) TaxID=665912 RepID=M2TCQ2_COCSN|nr:uncharacterized protein COCSADRAFT_81990 [Bipolaris sorokiniana ND90Pr]EMD67011.1 hypothetical protein COCSADRAFT_81990 [Bipolaris sorokiniana ND90Pr]